MKVKIHKCRNTNHAFPIFAWLIMIFQGMNPFNKSSWSHMVIEYDENYYDVTGKGCRSHTRKFLESYRIIETHEMGRDLNNAEFQSWFFVHKGVGYDYLQVSGLLLRGLGLITFNKIGHNYKRLICNELIINHMEVFYKLEVCDSDSYDLLDTWKEVIKR